MLLNRALLVGIDTYDRFPPLHGCVNDVNALQPLLARHANDDVNFECHAYTSAERRVERRTLINAIDTLLAPGADIALFYFAGHGIQAPNDVILAAQDGTRGDAGLPLSDVMGRIQASPVPEVVLLLDCCFSGGAGGAPQLGSSVSILRHGVSILSASRPDQPSVETKEGRGAFSTFLCGALEGGAADVLGKVTIAGAYAYLSESFGSWNQRPTFKTNIERLHPLRACMPAVPIADLRRLPKIFRSEDEPLPLDSRYEPTAEPRDADCEAIFAILQKCRAAKLVEPIGTDHLYYAAIEKKSCRLTPLGRHYWRMAKRGRL